MPVPTTSEEIRSEFLRFFKEKEHEIVPSASLVPDNDPTILFTVAGMAQFKDVFLGAGTRPYVRAADTQKILRVSGKHNDLDEVGYDTYHLTFFEMLGNWSFGDYFKKEAISWAWELLTDRWGIDANRLYATVHGGDEELGLEKDIEAAGLWKSETSIDPSHILFFGSDDNFWTMGETGPCGPCSEIHIDLRSDEDRAAKDGKQLVNADHPEVIEIWNLVFIQYNLHQNAPLESLAAKHVDTGMGFERMVAAMQGKNSIYDTDLFQPIFRKLAELSPIEEVDGYDGMKGVETEKREKYRIAMRVIVDHIRTCVFGIADDVPPGNVGRNYVIRRILRRAVRYGYQTLGMKEPFMYKLVDSVVDKMSPTFPQLAEKRDYIARVIQAEEKSFLETLGIGLNFFGLITPYIKKLRDNKDAEGVRSELIKDNKAFSLLEKGYGSSNREEVVRQFVEVASSGKLPGQLAFLFHDTYGFPVDLTQLMLREEGLVVDMDQYTTLMTEQKERARSSSGFDAVESAESGDYEVVQEGETSAFEGYDRLQVAGARIMLIKRATNGEESVSEIVLDKTPFYAESGGQVGDTGTLNVGDEEIRVLDTKKVRGRIVHIVERLPADLMAPVKAFVDKGRREQITKHHTATHLLHAALRDQLGNHVAQKGSLVAPDRLRFDFSHFERIEPSRLRALENQVNTFIQRNISRDEERNVPMEEAIRRGAMALFGEKYGNTVRVITFDSEYSVELCGGTHVDATGELGIFRILSEGSVAAGIRRVEAVVGEAALSWIDDSLNQLDDVRSQFKVVTGSVADEVAQLLSENKRLEKELAQQRMSQLEENLDHFISTARDVQGMKLITGRLENLDMEALRTLGQTLRDRANVNAVSILGTVDPEGEKAYLVATVSDDLIKQGALKAGAIVGQLAKKVGGGGGGKPTLATAGGKKPENLDEALASANEVLEGML
ncbi:MAG: alanine--tRNA ligase [Rhodothermaceae bacterium]|nr:alanine--tRNA ligase [Rhodothermaceae bacterium]